MDNPECIGNRTIRNKSTKTKIIKQCYMYQLAEGNIKNLNKHVFHSKREKKHVTR
jgi:hypothetical protein